MIGEPDPPPPMSLDADAPWWRPPWQLVAVILVATAISLALVTALRRAEERDQLAADACAAKCAPAAPEFRRVGSRLECYCDATVRAP